jgi:ABC-type dipeptide/oligopeptide/nickel transport system permease subunit
VTRIARLLGAPGAVAGSLVLAVILGLAVMAPLLAPYDWNATSQCRRLAPISVEHWFGCDLFGRDLLSRVMYGARFSLAMGISTVAISLVFGALLGVTIAYGGGRVDAIGARTPASASSPWSACTSARIARRPRPQSAQSRAWRSRRRRARELRSPST